MRLPRDVSGARLSDAIKVLGYEITRQTGSHIRLTNLLNGEHHTTIPNHASIRVGTLSEILSDIAAHHGLTRDELLNRLSL